MSINEQISLIAELIAVESTTRLKLTPAIKSSYFSDQRTIRNVHPNVHTTQLRSNQ